MNWLKQNILPSIVTTIILAILGFVWNIWITINSLPDKLDDNKAQHERYDELIQQEIEKRIELEKQVLILQTEIKSLKH